MDESARAALRLAWRRHERRWQGNQYVYPVIGRRSRGVSIGLNLSPDKTCNFDCVYCQVDRTTPPVVRAVEPARLRVELDGILRAASDGSLYEHPPFSDLPLDARGVRDIALSGDGEPTLSPRFSDAVAIAVEARRRFRLDAAKIVLITNGTNLKAPGVRESLRLLDDNNGEIWAKLDAGSDEHFSTVNRSRVSFGSVLENILDAARARPIVIQTLWFATGGRPAPAVDAYCRTLNDLAAAGARFKRIQVYTIARVPAEPFVSALADGQLDAIAERIRAGVDAPVEVFYGVEPVAGRVGRPGV